jgi:hypothetical protein
MFRTDRDALAQEVEDLRRERAELRAQNDAMRTDLLARRQNRLPVRVMANVYKHGIGHLTPGERAALARHDVEAFPIWAVLLLHFATLGVFSLVHFSRLHGRLPRAEDDDPSAAKAVGLSFIPYWHFYWWVFNPLRLADRINLQFRLRGLPDAVPRGLVIAAGVTSVVPQLLMVLGFPIFWPIAIVLLQRAANQLAALPQVGADAPLTAAATADAPRLRVPLVQDLPGPDDALEHQHQAELEADEASPERAHVR